MAKQKYVVYLSSIDRAVDYQETQSARKALEKVYQKRLEDIPNGQAALRELEDAVHRKLLESQRTLNPSSIPPQEQPKLETDIPKQTLVERIMHKGLGDHEQETAT